MPENIERRFNWKKDKFDNRDYKHSVSTLAIPTSYTLDTYIPSVRDQGSISSCVGFGVGGILTGLAKQLSAYTEWFSPTWIYNGARYIEGTLTEDDGCYTRDAMSWIKNKGCLLEQYWPYNSTTLDTSSPASDDATQAAKYPILSYYRVTRGSSSICSALSSGNLIMIGTPWFTSWMNIPSTGILPYANFRESVAGGHATFIYGYDQTSKYFYGQNSWGTEWGNSGKFLMPFSEFDSVFTRLGGYDAYYIKCEWSSNNEDVTSPTSSVSSSPSSSSSISPSASESSSPSSSPSESQSEETTTTNRIIWVQESIDNGTSWSTLYKG